MILIPKLLRPDSGLTRLTNNRYSIRWTVDGKPKRRNIRAATPEEARRVRDYHYAKLRAAGAIITGSPEHIEATDRGIYCYYTVKTGGRHIGNFKTREEAEAALAATQFEA